MCMISAVGCGDAGFIFKNYITNHNDNIIVKLLK